MARAREVDLATLVKFRLDDGDAIVVEMDDEQAGVVPAGLRPGEVAKQATESFEEALRRVRPIATTVFDSLRPLAPSELTVELGLKLSADFGAILAKASGEANIKVVMKWSEQSTT